MKKFSNVITTLLEQIINGDIRKAEGNFEQAGKNFDFVIYTIGNNIIRIDLKRKGDKGE